MSSTLQQTQKNTRYSEDVKEALSLAGGYARKAGRKELQDTDVLLGVLRSNRTFTSQDALLKQLGIQPGKLLQKLTTLRNEELKGLRPSADQVAHAALGQAEVFAGKAANGLEAPTVEIEHLIAALSVSSEPIVRAVLAEYNLSPERVAEAAHHSRRGSGRRQVLFIGRELTEVVVFVLFFLVLIKSLFGELRLIPSESMLPGLRIDDRVVIERLTHWARPYQRGDVLVFYPPMTQLKYDPWSVFLRLTGFSGLIYKKEDNIDVAYIKRLIGLPGDRVEVRPGVGVFINGRKLDEPYISEVAQSCTLVQPVTICQPVTVPENTYFMMGDNRNQSADSRYWGFEPESRVIGRAVFRIWPLDRLGALESPGYDDGKSNP